MTLGDEDAREAYSVFYSRHASWLLETIRRRAPLLRFLGGDDGAQDVVQDTFTRAFERAETFNSGGLSDPVRIRRRVRAWLARIANNLVNDELRGGPAPGIVKSLEDLGTEPPEFQDFEEDLHAQQLRNAVEELSDEDQDIVWTWAQFYKPGAKHQRLPVAESKALAERLGMTPDGIRQRRSRILRELRTRLTH